MELSETLLTLVVGSLLVPTLQWFKIRAKLSGVAMLWVAVVISFILSAAMSILLKDGGLSALLADPTLLFTGGGTIFATAQVVYRIFADKMGLGGAK